MRYDMKKLICERERVGSSNKSYKTGAKLDPTFDYDSENYDPGPGRIKTGVKWLRHWDHKYLNENLNPLHRFLMKSVGRPWDDVYSELCEGVDRRRAIGFHVFQHVRQWISDVLFFDGEPYDLGSYGGPARPYYGLYVDQQGVLCNREKVATVHPPAEITSLHWYGDTWLKLEVLAAPADECGCVHFKVPQQPVEEPIGKLRPARYRWHDMGPAVCIHGREKGKRPIWYVIEYGRHSPDEVYRVYHYEDGERTRTQYNLTEPGQKYIIYYRDVPKQLAEPIILRKKVANRRELKLIKNAVKGVAKATP